MAYNEIQGMAARPVYAGDDVAIVSFGAMTRGSLAMLERRRRILHETRLMMSQSGAEGLAMRDLARRADVSLRTLYNAFGSKDVLIVAAISQYYDRFLHALSDESPPDDLKAVIDTVSLINLRNQQIRPYLSALVGLYFSSSATAPVRAELRRAATGFMRPWLQIAQARRQLRPGTDLGRFLADIASLQYAINQEWLGGMLADDDFVPAILDGVLTHFAGIVRGAALKPLDELLRDLRGERVLTGRMIASAYSRLDSMFAPVRGQENHEEAKKGSR